MTKFLVDESCPRAVVLALRIAGYDLTYAADTHRRASDAELVALARMEGRIIVTEDFDFGELLIRRQFQAPGAIIFFLPRSSPDERAARLMRMLELENIVLSDHLTILTARRVRQRALST